MKEILFFQVIFENFLRSDYVIISGCNKSQKYEIYLASSYLLSFYYTLYYSDI